MHKGYKCLDVEEGWAYISRDVIFDENIYPFASLHPNVGARLRFEIILPYSLQNSVSRGDNSHDPSNLCPSPDNATDVLSPTNDPIIFFSKCR